MLPVFLRYLKYQLNKDRQIEITIIILVTTHRCYNRWHFLEGFGKWTTELSDSISCCHSSSISSFVVFQILNFYTCNTTASIFLFFFSYINVVAKTKDDRRYYSPWKSSTENIVWMSVYTFIYGCLSVWISRYDWPVHHVEDFPLFGFKEGKKR